MKIRPYQLFLIGLVCTLIILSILYWLLPLYVYYGGGWSIYKPGQSLPEHLRTKSDATNIYLLKRLGTYALIYWIQFTLVYYIVEQIKRFRLSGKLVLFHFYLSLIGVSLAVFLNRFIILPQLQSSYLSDIYISKDLTEAQHSYTFQLMLYYDSITTPTFIFGVFLLVLGLIVFVNNLRRGLVNSQNEIL